MENGIIPNILPRFPGRGVVLSAFDLGLQSVPSSAVILHRLNQPTIFFAILPREVFRSSFKLFLLPRSFRYCRGGCPFDAVIVDELQNLSALVHELQSLHVQYWERSVDVSIQLVLRFIILEVQPDVVPALIFSLPRHSLR